MMQAAAGLQACVGPCPACALCSCYPTPPAFSLPQVPALPPPRGKAGAGAGKAGAGADAGAASLPGPSQDSCTECKRASPPGVGLSAWATGIVRGRLVEGPVTVVGGRACPTDGQQCTCVSLNGTGTRGCGGACKAADAAAAAPPPFWVPLDATCASAPPPHPERERASEQDPAPWGLAARLQPLPHATRVPAVAAVGAGAPPGTAAAAAGGSVVQGQVPVAGAKVSRDPNVRALQPHAHSHSHIPAPSRLADLAGAAKAAPKQGAVAAPVAK